MVLGVLLALASARPARVAAQEVIPGGERALVTPELDPEHWAMEAARRAESLGLLSRPLPFRRAIPVATAGEVFEEAAAAARGRGAGLEALTEGWRERFAQEFGGLAGEGRVGALRLLGVRAGVQAASRAGGAGPGFGERPQQTGATPLGDRSDLALDAEVVAGGDWVGVLAEPVVRDGTDRLRRVDVVVGWEAWRLAVGRQPVGYGKTQPGGLVLNGAVPLNRLELRTERPGALGGVLRYLGPSAAQLFIGRLSDERHEREPYLWGGSASIQPFPRFGVAVHRAAMFGGREWHEPLTVKTIVDMLIGRVAGLGFENQIVSVEGRFRLPTEELVPLTAYLEWGAEDAAGGWWDVPARVIGLESPAIPGLEALALGAAYTDIAARCCYNSAWYRHVAFQGNWAEADRPLGHPLGGEGAEYTVYGSFDDAVRAMRIEGRIFRRDREGENLYVPGREESTGVALEADWRPRPRVELDARLRVETGSDWTERELGLRANLFF
jgi:hypothetical protein